MIFVIIAIVIISIIIIINFVNKAELKKMFKKNNVIVFGKKGTGKDMIFNYITNTKEYYANIPYSKLPQLLVKVSDLKLGDNTFETLLNDKVIKVSWPYKENTDVFISDCGVYLPSQYDYILHKKYGGLPLLYALSRHIGNFNIHCNAQALERIWKPLREQADWYIKTLDTVNLPFMLLTKYRIYDKYSSALNDVRPLKMPLLGKSEPVNQVHLANTGIVKEKWIIQLKRNVKYDTRYFRKIFIKG